MAVTLPDAPPMTSLSPAEILDCQLPPTQFGELDASICDASEEGALPTINDFDMRDVMDLPSDLKRDSLEEVVANSADQHEAKQMEAIIALVNALSKARIGTPSANEIIVDIPTFATPELVQVPQHFSKEEDKMVMDSNEKFPECDSPPAIPVMQMAQERASQPEAGIIIQGVSSVLGPLPGSLLVHVPPAPTPHSVPAIERLVPQASSKPLADTMSVDKEPTGGDSRLARGCKR